MEPYRSAPTVRAAETPRDAGIVDDIIRQFADPMAFYRELVQNSIDAGTESIDVRLRFGPETVKVAVIDRGEGMTRDVLENRLLVLFRSTKEADDDKIGKFGVGFASVLALGPSVVSVTTVRDGRRLVLHLFRDLSYELYDAGPAERSGTMVELEVPRSGGVESFIEDSVRSLVRWCRHARVPIHFTAFGLSGDELRRARIDRPLALARPLVEISAESGDGMVAVVGIERGLRPYAGFFNHGLTLHESSDPAFGRLAFKVQDARLGHTMSRDNVRRDARFDEAMAFVRQVARTRLSVATGEALRESLEAGDLERYVELIEAVAVLTVGLSRELLVFPLLEPIGDARIASAAALRKVPVWLSRSSSRVTKALAGAGIPVVHHCDEVVETLLRSASVGLWGDANRSLTLVEPVAPSDSDRALLEQLESLLDRSHRRPPAIHLAELRGARAGELAITGSRADSRYGETWLLDLESSGRDPFAWVMRPHLILNALHRVVSDARGKAAEDPVTAASLLARILMLQFGDLDRKRSERLAVETVRRILGEGRR